MLATLVKYANAIITLVTLCIMVLGAVLWVPDTFLTRTLANEHFTEIKNSALQRDKDLHQRLTLNYLETQIRLNEIIIKDYEDQQKRGPLSTENEIEFEALKRGQANLIVKRNELVKGDPEWLE